MKEAFKLCMRHMYPDGVTTREQLRDLVRTFSMGWCEGLKSVGHAGAVSDWADEFHFLGERNWMPDGTWNWR